LKPIAVTRFTTDAFAPKDRHEAWANRDWPAIGPLFDARPIGLFHNRSERFALGSLAVHVSEMGGQTYRRSAARARRDGVDGLIVELLLTGHTVADAAGRSTGNVAGAMVFNDLAQEHAHRSTDTHTLLLSVPREVAASNNLDVPALHGQRVSPDGAALVRNHLLSVHRLLPRLDAGLATRLGQTTLDLIGVALDLDGLRAPAASREARDTATLLEAQRLIDALLASPLLTVEWLCGRLRTSRSRLYRLFDGQGGVLAYVRDRRLDRIRDGLAAPGSAERLADLAADWGFNEAGHLSRAFRRRFGLSPSEFRAAARQD
jgi:AraC-like DNA-binding protein